MQRATTAAIPSKVNKQHRYIGCKPAQPSSKIEPNANVIRILVYCKMPQNLCLK